MLKITHENQVSLISNTVDVNVMILRKDIQEAIWKQNPTVSVVYVSTFGSGNVAYIYVFVGDNQKKPYSLITVEDMEPKKIK